MDTRPTIECLVCEAELGYEFPPEFGSRNPRDGSYLKIHSGYGSCHDGDTHEGFICDSCLTNLRDKSLVKCIDSLF